MNVLGPHQPAISRSENVATTRTAFIRMHSRHLRQHTVLKSVAPHPPNRWGHEKVGAYQTAHGVARKREN